MRKFETKARYTFELNFLQKRDYPFYIKQCSYQVLKCIIDFINKNCQVAFIFNNLQYPTKILRLILLSPLPMLFASIWNSFLEQTSVLLLCQYTATLSRGRCLVYICKVDHFKIFRNFFRNWVSINNLCEILSQNLMKLSK